MPIAQSPFTPFSYIIKEMCRSIYLKKKKNVFLNKSFGKHFMLKISLLYFDLINMQEKLENVSNAIKREISFTMNQYKVTCTHILYYSSSTNLR